MQIRRRTFLTALMGTVSTAALSSIASKPVERPNIVFFFVDDMGWQDTSVPFYYQNGKAVITPLNRRYKTPNMQRLADKGMLFTDAYAQPICSPSRCSFISGMNSARHRVTDWTLRVDRANQRTNNGLREPAWASNGIQPTSTTASGTCQPPFWAPGVTDAQKRPLPYTMRKPFISAKGLPQFLRELGYTTIHAGKAHYGSSSYTREPNNWGAPTPGADPTTFGFDINIAGCEIGAPGAYRGNTKYGACAPGKRHGMAVPGLDENSWDNFTKDVFLTQALTNKALDTISAVRKQTPNKPFFIQLAHYAIHDPIANNYSWDKRYSSDPSPAKDTLCPNPKDGMTWNINERNYVNLIRGMDDSLGAVMDYLDANNLADNTIILFMSDNGAETGRSGGFGYRMPNACAPLKGGKGSCYEGGIREPMIVSWPGVTPPASRCTSPVIIEDFFPSILEMAGNLTPLSKLPGLASTHYLGTGEIIDQVIDGTSFVPLLKGLSPSTDRPLLFHSPNPWTSSDPRRDGNAYNHYTAMRYGDYKLIYQHDTQDLELYHLPTDICETTNLATRDPGRVTQLATIMSNELRRYHAQMPTYLPSNAAGFTPGTTVPYPDQITHTPDQ